MTGSDFPAYKCTVMVVDDEPEFVTLVRAILEDCGFSVMCAYNGSQLFDTLERQKPDLIILDVVMSEIDGLEVLARLKGDQETSSIPVILLTVQSDHEQVWAGYKIGADYYITKPFRKTQLLEAINLIFSGDQGLSNRVNQFIKACLSVNTQ